MRLPRLLLCAPSSGAGKTTVTCAVLQALQDLGYRPASFKSGPDYIDPMFHREVIGTYSANLDLFLMGEEAVRAQLAETGGKAGLAVIEGAMGYYDGIAMGETASAYDLARRTRTPAVLVVNAKGQALSAAAVVKGIAAFRADSQIQGVLLNWISPMSYPRLKEMIEVETGVRVYGFLPDSPDCTLESRHLGLVTAAEVDALREKLSRLSALAREHIDLEGLAGLAGTAPPLDAVAPALTVHPDHPRVAVAADRAFCFYYGGALSLREKRGARLVEFSPLEDEALPAGVSGLYLGGGYPELYAKRLSENQTMCRSVREAVEGGLPTVAECGGFLYLHRTMEDGAGTPWPLCGVIPADAVRTNRLRRFGYITMIPRTDGLLGSRPIPAHEFHYWESGAPGNDFQARKPQSERGWDCAYHTPTLYAGFPHFHFCAVPEAAARFVAKCAEYNTGR